MDLKKDSTDYVSVKNNIYETITNTNQHPKCKKEITYKINECT